MVIFYPALREERRLAQLLVYLSGRYFYPRPPRGGRLVVDIALASASYFSIHALREEGDHAGAEPDSGKTFSPRPPRGGRRNVIFVRYCHFSISIHALREEGDLSRPFIPVTVLRISIHASGRGGRQCNSFPCPCEQISIHALREGGRPRTGKPLPGLVGFLSTPSARRGDGFCSSGH